MGLPHFAMRGHAKSLSRIRLETGAELIGRGLLEDPLDLVSRTYN